MPTTTARRPKLPIDARRIPISITLAPDSHALLIALAKAQEGGNRSAVVERLIRQSIQQPVPA